MELLPIGAFARASRLSPKALRLYDELGLLTPAQVDPGTGYRFYRTDQLERARLVAWLRRLGMPLSRIGVVCGLSGPDAAAAVSAFWAGAEADLAERRELAVVLIDHLSHRDTVAKDPTMTTHLQLRYAVLSDRGLARDTQQDAAFANERVLAVADGCGPGGARASVTAIETLVTAATDDGIGAAELLNQLQDAVAAANASIAALPVDAGQEQGTTLTAMVLAGSDLALVHIGDCRAYLYRDGDLSQITHDHTVVQAMVDDGRLSLEEAATHPQRSMLVRVLDGTADHARPELRLHDARPGDRYLLCSDGLSVVVAPDDLRRVVAAVADPQDAVASWSPWPARRAPRTTSAAWSPTWCPRQRPNACRRPSSTARIVYRLTAPRSFTTSSSQTSITSSHRRRPTSGASSGRRATIDGSVGSAMVVVKRTDNALGSRRFRALLDTTRTGFGPSLIPISARTTRPRTRSLTGPRPPGRRRRGGLGVRAGARAAAPVRVRVSTARPAAGSPRRTPLPRSPRGRCRTQPSAPRPPTRPVRSPST